MSQQSIVLYYYTPYACMWQAGNDSLPPSRANSLSHTHTHACTSLGGNEQQREFKVSRADTFIACTSLSLWACVALGSGNKRDISH